MKVEKIDYSKTLNLPKTSFQMRANLSNKEPQILNKWKKQNIYEKSIRSGSKKFILHDGPPYANGEIHIGHALNKILKDVILKYKRLQDFYAPYVPGWDTHGLPIELKVTEELGNKIKDMNTLKIREKCTKYAKKWVEKQKVSFKRLGILGEWDNPYLTLTPEYEAKQLEVFKELYENGYIFKGLKPIYWSPVTKTALAEAEIEYHNYKSPSVFVKMEANTDVLEKIEVDEASFVIWTTTPWTLPANMAICLNSDFEYGVYKTNRGNLILAVGLAESALAKMGIEDAKFMKKFKGDFFEKLTYRHPFLDRTGIVVLGDHVTLEAGTGCVHTAPGHGQDDYVVAIKYGIEVICPVDQDGHLTEEAGEKFAGLFYKKANSAIIEELKNSGHLLYTEVIEHSYPHDWRSQTPVIFRATEQWFVKIEGSDIREKSLEALKNVEFLPAWGRNRITTMIENRPDWCISRQRVWGVYIPIFYNNKTGEVIFNSEIIDRVINFVKKDGAAAWLKYTAEELIGEELLLKYNLKNIELRKETNIMDVWFDSGVTHRSVLETRDNLKRPADLYLEGSDQHRGWFQTSLLTSIGSTGDAPYKAVLTHGFVNDGNGKKMSKSLGNVVSPDEITKIYGADILRLWCASVDYSEDVKISDNIIKQISESYRRIRNTARYILGNINDFDSSKDSVPYSELTEIDQWALHKLEKLKNSTTSNFDKYEFYHICNDIHYFIGIEMSAFYLDIIKDRLYVSKTSSIKRRAAQTVMYEILVTITKMISPILSFTAEELWDKLPDGAKDRESVLLTSWYKPSPSFINRELENKWDAIIKLKKDVNKILEIARQGENRIIGNPQDAYLELYIGDNTLKSFITLNKNLLETVFMVSKFEISEIKTDEFAQSDEIKELFIKVSHAKGKKCERCWKYSENIRQNSEYTDICPRCIAVLTT